jgi:membrane protein
MLGMDHPQHYRGESDRQRPPAKFSDASTAVGQAKSASPRRRWKGIALAVFSGISEDQIFLVAAGVGFYAIIALFPGIAAMVSVYGLFADPAHIAGHLNTISGIAPGGAVEVLRDQLARLAHQNRTTLGFGFAASFVIALWFANSGTTGLFNALNMVFEEKEQRSLWRYYTQSLAFTAGGLVLVLLSLAVIVAIPVVLNYIPGAKLAALPLELIRWPVLFLMVSTALTVVYRYAPCRNAARWRPIVWSSVFAAAAWLGVSAVFSWYVANFGSYNKTYGSLGAIFGFMTWMWISMVIVLIGAKLDAELERSLAGRRPARID